MTKRTGIRIKVGAAPVYFDVEPFTLDGQTLAQVRPLAEAMGAAIAWDSTTQMVRFTRGNRTANCQVGSEVGVTNGEGYWLEQPPLFVGQTLVVPLRFVADALGFKAHWDEPNSTITLVSG